MTIHWREKSGHDTLEMTDDHALAMWVSQCSSIRSRLAPVLAGRLETVVFTAFDAQTLDRAVDEFWQTVMKCAEKRGLVEHNAPPCGTGAAKDDNKQDEVA